MFESDLRICRICLRTECKMYKYDRFQLDSYYEELSTMKLPEPDRLPRYFCFECAAMLHKFHRFKVKCLEGHTTLRQLSELQWSHGGITYEAVNRVDRKSKNLQSLDVLTVTERVKTFCQTHSTGAQSHSDTGQAENSEAEIAETELVKVEEENGVETQFYQENVLERDISSSGTSDDDGSQHSNSPEPTSTDSIKDTRDSSPSYIKDHFKRILRSTCSALTDPPSIQNELQVHGDTAQSTSQLDVKKATPKFTKKAKTLDATLWKRHTLTEEQAWREFCALALQPKYAAAEHRCSLCHAWFRTRDICQRHNILKHSHSRGAHECRFCHMRFRHEFLARKHAKIHFLRFECLRCGLRTCSQSSAEVHEEMHKGAAKQCCHCGETFRHQSTYYTHLRTHRSPWVCPRCGVALVSRQGLQMHQRVAHCLQDDHGATEHQGREEEDDDDLSARTDCAKCGVRFHTRQAYVEHVFQSTAHADTDGDEHDHGDPDGNAAEDKAEQAPKKVLSKTRKEQIVSKMKGCSDSADAAALDGWLKPQRRKGKVKRVNRKPTTCHQCGEVFSTQAACMRHHRLRHPHTSFHPAAERHICELCGASLAPGSIAVHQNMHSRAVTHTCETCGRSFHTLVSLRRHSLTHSGEKPFPCALCDKRFTQSNSMKLHYRTVHLKQPYPKRNRRKKQPPLPAADPACDSKPAPEAEPLQAQAQAHCAPSGTGTDDTMEYTTLA